MAIEFSLIASATNQEIGCRKEREGMWEKGNLEQVKKKSFIRAKTHPQVFVHAF
jgi:hypothetical protein